MGKVYLSTSMDGEGRLHNKYFTAGKLFADLYKLQGFHSTSVVIDLFCGARTAQTRDQYKQSSVALLHLLDWLIPGNQIYIHKSLLFCGIMSEANAKYKGLHGPLKLSDPSHCSASYTWCF